MFKSIKEFIFGKPPQAPVNPQITDAVTQAPYKVELPLVKLEQESAPVVEAIVEVAPVVEAAPVSKTRKPRAAAKKAAPGKKAAAMKATKTTKSKKS
jgi:hypothetical protein